MFQARYEVQKKNSGSFYFTHMLFFENDEKLGTESFQQFFVTMRCMSSLTASHLEQAASVSLLSHEYIILSFG